MVECWIGSHRARSYLMDYYECTIYIYIYSANALSAFVMFVFYVVLIQSTRATFGGLAVCIEQCVSLYAVIPNANLLCFHLAFARKHHRLVYICCWCWTYYTMCDHKEDIIIVHLGAIWVPHRTNSICIYASMPPVLAHFETYIYIHIVLCESQRVGVPPA